MAGKNVTNPFRPGAGYSPPYLAGRDAEIKDFKKHLDQEVILRNIILSGLRGVGKTALLSEFKQVAVKAGWLWVGDDISESASLTEEKFAIRLLTDLSVMTSANLLINTHEVNSFGFDNKKTSQKVQVSFDVLKSIYDQSNGLVLDKLKSTVEFVLSQLKVKQLPVVFAYDEAQNLGDKAQDKEYPLSLLIDLFQSLQRKEFRILLVLTGLPTLFPALVEARTSSERMFHNIQLERLDSESSRKAISEPIKGENMPKLSRELIEQIIEKSAGYPYFIQFICREIYDVAIQKSIAKEKMVVNLSDIIRKLDSDFFDGRWSKTTDRQRELLYVIGNLSNHDTEFTVNEIVEGSKKMYAEQIISNTFGSSQVNQMLSALTKSGLIYKNRHGRYLLAVPLFGQYIKRQSV